MYSPNVPRYDGWYVIPATLRDGRRVNLWHHGPELHWEKPERISGLHRSARMAAHEFKLGRPDYDAPGYAVHRERWAHWLCEQWNARDLRDAWVESLEIWFMLEPTAPVGVEPRVKRRLLHRHTCEAGGDPAHAAGSAPAAGDRDRHSSLGTLPSFPLGSAGLQERSHRLAV